jgi:propanol-preferring alcohol dehydrogenase
MTRTSFVMQLDRIGAALRYVERPVPEPGPGELRVRVLACGVCRTDLHMIDGEVPANLPIVPGHEIVGRVEALGEGVRDITVGDRIGIPWLGATCGVCPYCGQTGKTFATAPYLPARCATAAMPCTRLPRRVSACRFLRTWETWKPRRCSAPD